jgi:hypothetical protein
MIALYGALKTARITGQQPRRATKLQKGRSVTTLQCVWGKSRDVARFGDREGENSPPIYWDVAVTAPVSAAVILTQVAD